MLISENPERLHRLVVVVQRFAHSHQHDVEASIPHRERIGEDPYLAHNLSRRQISDESHLSRQAELARHRTANLSRNTEGHGRRVWNEHRLYVLPVREAEEKLLCAVD